ncbi:MAG: SDR family oxidoreductase [Polyangiaceae bacterium]|nr:SDR family oxidoreductase [Polyangiaceae bacterium]
MSETVLITGTSSGIGLATALECAGTGLNVIATMRDLNKRERLEKEAKERGVRIHVEQLDVTHDGAGDKVRELILKYGPVYSLVNNAGIGVVGAFEEQTEAEIREQFDTNVLGMMAITRAVLPSMRAAGRGQIINLSSISGRLAPPILSIYGATKHAVEGFSDALRWEVDPFGIKVVVVQPGLIKTAIFFENLRRGSLIAAEGPYAPLTSIVEKKFIKEAENGQDPAIVGKAIAKIVADPSPPFRVAVGNDARAVLTLQRLLPEGLFSLAMRQALRQKK